ncbi:hypothetical protein LCGC14_0937530 [marine sediment metagenome]|uniref:Uncharacterized protein n=1 Tax=marine sediment metagenome TaxID=412755 RepID=A0A0F9JR37_9ZZZZ
MILIATETMKTGQLISWGLQNEASLSRPIDETGTVIGMAARDISKGEDLQYSVNQNTNDILTHVDPPVIEIVTKASEL